jgi:hypothetical protein
MKQTFHEYLTAHPEDARFSWLGVVVIIVVLALMGA